MIQHPEISDSDLHVIVKFFMQDEFARRLPLVRGFPYNCCEIVSAIVAEALSRKYNERDLIRVCGTRFATDERHYWIESRGLAIDPTAHQFDEFSQPFICNAPHPLAISYDKRQEESTTAALFALRTLRIDEQMQEIVIQRLIDALTLSTITDGT